MSFNSLKYDPCAYKANLQTNVSSLSYVLDNTKFENCSKCRHELGLAGGAAVSHVTGNLVDLESTLFGIDREASKCASLKYLPSDDNVAKGANYYRPVCTNTVDVSLKHLQPCQLYNTLEVPKPPMMQPFSCPRK
jgi:hypothetical protein